MFAGRRATAAEMEQGQQEMEAAQKRLDEQREKGTEMPLEDVKGPEGAESFESPRTTLRATVQGGEERPKGSPKSLGPPVPAFTTTEAC